MYKEMHLIELTEKGLILMFKLIICTIHVCGRGVVRTLHV